MTPEYLYALADIADPDKLWSKAGRLNRADMQPEQRQQLDTGVALRRLAHHYQRLERARAAKRSVLITPLSINGSAIMEIDTPPQHERLRHDDRGSPTGDTGPMH